MKLYTRGGDQGDTGLRGGGRVPKENLRVAAYGDLDELCSHLGLAQALLPKELRSFRELLEQVQHELFILSAELSTPPEGKAPTGRIEERHVQRLEQEIDLLASSLKDRKSFVLPRGTPAAAELHVARAVARRAERTLVQLHRAAPLRPVVLAYLNRLSGLLYAMALSTNHQTGFDEVVPDYTR